MSGYERGAGAPSIAPQRPEFEITGPRDAPVVVALGGISATRRVSAAPGDTSPGWWDGVVGPERAIDTCRRRVLGVDYLDGGVDEDGRPLHVVSTHDQADAIVAILDELGVDRASVVGASYGGMVGLALAESYPGRVERLVVIGAAHEPHPMTTALRSLQRRIVELGLGTGRERDALSIARGLGITTYRSATEFAGRFDTAPTELGRRDARFPVERYLAHCGDRFAATWTPARFLALSLSADLHRVDPSRITAPTTLIALQDDAVTPLAQLEALAASLAGPARLAHLPTPYGHDAFLVETTRIGQLVAEALTFPESR